MRGSPLQHRMDLPCPGKRRAERIQAELTVDILPNRVVDTGYPPPQFEDLGGDRGGHDVPIGAVGQGSDPVRRFDARLAKDVLVDPIAEDHLAGEVVTEPVERPAVAIDDGDLVPGFGEGDGGHGAHAAAPNDDELHELSNPILCPTSRGPAGRPRPRAARPLGFSPGWPQCRTPPARNGLPAGSGRRPRRPPPGCHRGAAQRYPG